MYIRNIIYNQKFFLMYYRFLVTIQYMCLFSFDLDFREWIVEIGWYSYWRAMYAVMISMVCVAIVSIVGIFGAVEVT